MLQKSAAYELGFALGQLVKQAEGESFSDKVWNTISSPFQWMAPQNRPQVTVQRQQPAQAPARAPAQPPAQQARPAPAAPRPVPPGPARPPVPGA
jgi:hypothetical protein